MKNNDNLMYYEQLRCCPETALRTIQAGRLKGKSDINPVWRIKAMTEVFGPCGIGWKYEITRQWELTFGQEVKAFVNINLFIKVDGAWSEAIPGTGGATLVEVGKSGLYVNDEGYKMALTDALSVAMKSLGVAADVYYSRDKQAAYETKYGAAETMQQAQQYQQPVAQPVVQPVQPQQPAQQTELETAIGYIKRCTTIEELKLVYNTYTLFQKDGRFLSALSARRKVIQ